MLTFFLIYPVPGLLFGVVLASWLYLSSITARATLAPVLLPTFSVLIYHWMVRMSFVLAPSEQILETPTPFSLITVSFLGALLLSLVVHLLYKVPRQFILLATFFAGITVPAVYFTERLMRANVIGGSGLMVTATLLWMSCFASCLYFYTKN